MTTPEQKVKISLDDSDYSRGMARASGQWDQFGAKVQQSGGPIGSISSQLGFMATPAGAAATAVAGLGVAMVKATQASIAWETSMADVAKTAGAATDVAALGDALLSMSTVPGMPVKEDLADIATNAGALGVNGTQAVLDFTESIAMATTAFGGMSAGDVASNLAKMENVFGLTADQSMNLAAAVDYVGNNLAATEAQVMPAAQKMSGLGAMYGMTATEALGLSGSLIDLGMQVDSAGTLTTSLMTKLTDPASWGKAGELVGMTADEFGRLATSDVDEAMLEIAEALEQIADPAERAQAIADLKLGTEAAQPLLKMVGHTEEIRENMEGTADAFEDTSDFAANFENKAGTSAASISTIVAQVGVIAVKFGDVVNESETFQGVLGGISGALGLVIDNMDTITGLASHLGEDISSGLSWLYEASPLDDIAGAVGAADEKWNIGERIWGGIKEYAGTAGEESGEEYDAGVKAATDDTGEETAENLASPDAKKAAEESGAAIGKSYSDAFIEEFVEGSERAWEIGIDHLATAGTRAGSILDNGDYFTGRGSWKDAGYERGVDYGDGFWLGFKYIASSHGDEDLYKFSLSGQEFSYNIEKLREERKAAGDLIWDEFGGGYQYAEGAIDTKAYAALKAIEEYEAANDIELNIPLSVVYEWIGEPELAAAQAVKEADDALAAATQAESQAAFESAFAEALEKPFAVGGLGDRMADLLGEVAEDGWAAFEDGLVSAADASDIADQLADLKLADPEAFEEAGGQAALDWWRRFTGMLEQRAYNIANNIDCTGIDEEIQKHIDAGEPYVAKVEVQISGGILSPEARALRDMLWWHEYGGSETQKGLGEFADDFRALGQYAEEVGGLFADAYEIITNPWDYSAGEVQTAMDYLNTLVEGLGIDPRAVQSIAEYFVQNTKAGMEKAARDLKKEYEDQSEWSPMSWFGYWQENTEGLFNDSYIGPTEGWAGPGQGAKEGYEAQNFFQYGVEVDLELDPSEANAELETLETDIEAEKIAPVEADIAPALSELERLEVEIRRPVTKPVYLEVIGTSQGIIQGGLGNEAGVEPWLSFASGGIATYPVAAIIGDAPTPEVVAPLGDLLPMIQQAVATAGGNSAPTIQGPLLVIQGDVTSDVWPKVERAINDLEARITRAEYRRR